MPKLTITPQLVLLTAGQAITFEAKEGETPVTVTWTLSPQIGKLATPDSSASGSPSTATQGTSASFIAPAILAGAQTIAVIASTAKDSASASISLTPDAIAIVPAKVNIKEGESQQFEAIVAPTMVMAAGVIEREVITWILSPNNKSGTLENGLYTPPSKIIDSTEVTVIAASPALGKQAVATINLVSPPWRGPGAYLLGFFLLLLFSLVMFMVGLWPPALPSPDAAKAARIEAENTLQVKSDALDKANVGVEASQSELGKIKQASPAGNAAGNKPDANAATLDAAIAKAKAADESLQRAKEAWDYAKTDLDKKRREERAVNEPTIQTTMIHHPISREIDLLLLVLLAGSLGSFLHIAPSFSDFMGNRTLKSTWAWWYALRPFIGAGLALVFYSASRAGLITNPSGLNPFGVVAVAAMVGMFSKAATSKLGEVFDTLFKTDKSKESKDKLASPTQTPTQPPAQSTSAK